MATRGEITKRSVDALKPDESKDAFLWDGKISGFGVRCRPSGAKYYFLKYRAGRKQRWQTIGEHGSPWTAETARSEALRLLGRSEAGADPAAERDAIKENPTVDELRTIFIEEHAKAKRKPSTATEYERLFEIVIKPRLGNIRVCDLTHADVAAFHFKMRATPYQANKTVALLKKMLNWARLRGARLHNGRNPAEGIEFYKEHKRTLFLNAEQLTKLGTAIRDLLNEKKLDPEEAAAIRLLLFTGCRLNEILTLRWDYVDKAAGVFNLPDSKTGAKTVQLSAPARAVLAELPRLKGNPFVISGRKKASHLINLQKPWRRVRARAGLDRIRIHDLRHAYGSMGASVGYGLPIVGALLGHTQPSTTARYAHVQNDPLKAAADAIASRLQEALDKEEPPKAKAQKA